MTHAFKEIKSENLHPLRFVWLLHDHTEPNSWGQVVDRCLQAWRITAPAFFTVENTGFKSSLVRRLNQFGLDRLPPPVAPGETSTRNPAVTDITEIIALQALEHQEPGLIFPYPRVLHKELGHVQHHGIDVLGYIRRDDSSCELVIVEVGASESSDHPPDTVADHREQLLDKTLNGRGHERLVRDLSAVHDECEEAASRDVLNTFLVYINYGQLFISWAAPVLVRPFGLFDEKDWGPFRTHTDDFERASLPARVWFTAVECSLSFPQLLEAVRRAVDQAAAGKEGE